MTVTMVSVVSADGRGTKWNRPGTFDWPSPEDQKKFTELRTQSEVLIMGRATWSVAKSHIRLSPDTLRIVLTRTPQAYEHEGRPGMLEFTSEEPAPLIQRLNESGRSRVLLVGGAQVNAMFLQANLVDEIITTVEPVIYGEGQPMVEHFRLEVPLRLLRSETLNSQGTLLLHYAVERSAASANH